MFFALAMYAALPLLQRPNNLRQPSKMDASTAAPRAFDTMVPEGRRREVIERLIYMTELVGLALAAAAVGVSRVYLQYHSLDQVSVEPSQ
jgi:membrane-associated phospholipid phosphatase